MFGLLGKMVKRLQGPKFFVGGVQHFEIDPSTGEVSANNSTYRGNTYIGDGTMISAISNAYSGTSDWGANMVKTIVDVRASMIAGAGIDVVPTPGVEGDAKEEIKFIKRLLSYNDINPKKQIDWAVEGGIEGRAFAFLRPVDTEEGKNVKVTFVPRHGSNYNIKTDPLDYTHIVGADLTVGERRLNAARPVPPEQFVYQKFGGRATKINVSSPVIGHVMPQIESLDKAMRDWREINFLFATPTPVVECEDAADASAQWDFMNNTIKWKIGKLLVIGGGTFKMVGPDIQGMESLEREIVTCVKVISAVTGIPPHFLGFPDIMTNRATADSVTEMLYSATGKERVGWIQFYTEIFRKSLVMMNKLNGTNYNPDAITAQLPEDAQTRLRQVIDVWLELFNSKAITRQTLLQKLPGVDPEDEAKRVKEALDNAEYEGVPLMQGTEQRGKPKGKLSERDPDDTRKKGALERRTSGQGRNAVTQKGKD